MSPITVFILRIALPFIFLAVTLYGILQLIGLCLIELGNALIDPCEWQKSLKNKNSFKKTPSYSFPMLPGKVQKKPMYF